MLLPQEIRNHEFARSIRGYNTAEVDEYILFLSENIDSLNRENDELDRKLTAAMEKLAELQAREARVARLDTEMRRAAATLLHEAEKQQKKILEEANAYASRARADADAHTAAQIKIREEIREEVLRFKNDLYARYGQHIDQLEEIALAAEKTAFETPVPETPAAPAPVLNPAEESVEESAPTAILGDPVIEQEPATIVEAEAVAAEPFAEENIEQMDLFDPIDDTEAINKELEEMMAGTEEIWTDYTDAIVEEEIDPGFALPASKEEDAFADESFFDEPEAPAENEPEAPGEEDDALLLQNLRRAFSVEFDTFEPGTSSTKKAPAEDADEFSFVENEAPKKRGFLSRLIGGDSDGE